MMKFSCKFTEKKQKNTLCIYAGVICNAMQA